MDITASTTSDKISNQEISQWLRKSGGRGKTIQDIIRIPGDASTRMYYRIKVKFPRPATSSKADSNLQSFILMKMEPFSESAETPFLTVQKYLEKIGVEVPEVFDIDGSRGMILLEDLGDITLLKKLQDVNNSDLERHYYERAIDQLVQLQVFGTPQAGDKKLDAFQLRFDHEKLMWEVNFTIEHFYVHYLKRNLADGDVKVLQEGFSEICNFLANLPLVLVHRDFHSRNIMVHDSRWVLIDFQDARMGPAHYDLASLLKDCYYQLEESQISLLIDYYIARYEAMSGRVTDQKDFRYAFDLMSVQRNFKAIGSFASFLNRRGDPTYLKYIGNTFENIRRTLLKYPRYSRLREVLFQYYYF